MCLLRSGWSYVTVQVNRVPESKRSSSLSWHKVSWDSRRSLRESFCSSILATIFIPSKFSSWRLLLVRIWLRNLTCTLWLFLNRNLMWMSRPPHSKLSFDKRVLLRYFGANGNPEKCILLKCFCSTILAKIGIESSRFLCPPNHGRDVSRGIVYGQKLGWVGSRTRPGCIFMSVIGIFRDQDEQSEKSGRGPGNWNRDSSGPFTENWENRVKLRQSQLYPTPQFFPTFLVPG